MSFEIAKGHVRLGPRSEGARYRAWTGFPPAAVVLWWDIDSGSSAGLTARGGIGFAANGSGAGCVVWAAGLGQLAEWPAQAGFLGARRGDPRSAAAPRCVSWFDDGFELDLPDVSKAAYRLHYLAVGGPETRAAVRTIELDGTSLHAVRGLGFEPEAILFLSAVIEPLEPRRYMSPAFGVATRLGSQLACAFAAEVRPEESIVRGAQRADAVLAIPATGADGFSLLSRVVSFDDDGFTLETMSARAGARSLVCLALSGGCCSAGLGRAPRSPFMRSRLHVGFEPTGVLVFSWGLAGSAEVKDIGRLCVGGHAADGGTGCVSWTVRNRSAWPLEARTSSTTSSLLEVLDTTSGGLHASARMRTFRRDGFMLEWPVRDGVPREYVYVAFG